MSSKNSQCSLCAGSGVCINVDTGEIEACPECKGWGRG